MSAERIYYVSQGPVMEDGTVIWSAPKEVRFPAIVGTEEIRFTVDTRPIMIDVLRHMHAALGDAIEEIGNTRRGRALKRQAKKIERALVRREGKG